MTYKWSCRLSQLTWIYQGQHSSAQAESQCHHPAVVKPRWCDSWYHVRNSQRWWAVHCWSTLLQQDGQNKSEKSQKKCNLIGCSEKNWQWKNGLLLKSTWIIIPRVMKNRFLNELHTGHLGVTKCIELAKQTMYWPGINSDIEQFMATCQPCLKYAASNKKTPRKEEPVRNSSHTMDEVRNRHFYTG